MDIQRSITKEQLMDLIADMAAESQKLIPEEADPDDSYVKNAQSKADILEKWAEAEKEH